MFELIKSYFFTNLVKLSEYQLPTLRYLGSNGAEIEPRESHLYNDQIVQFQDYVKKYPKGSDSHNYSKDAQYKDYVKFIKKTAVKCNSNCDYRVCPLCSECAIDHQKDNCSDQKWIDVKANHSTWRSYFIEYNDTLKKHEWAIWHSYYDPISLKLWAKACPCHEVLYNGYDDETTIKALKHYDNRMLDLNVELITNKDE